MNPTPFELLRCPHCLSDLTLREVITQDSEHRVLHGILACQCQQYPLIHGVAYLKDPGTLRVTKAISQLKAGKISAATLTLIEERKKVKLLFTLLVLGRKFWIVKDILPLPRFLNLLSLVNPGSSAWYTHLASRSQRSTFMISLGTLSFTNPKKTLVDIGCGAGHFLQQADRLTKHQSLLGIDFDFSLLLLARWFVLSPAINLVCADIEQGIPLKTKAIETITVNDAFQYFEYKAAFVEEAKRVLRPSGQLFLTHVHWTGADNPGQGKGLTPQEIKQFDSIMPTFINSDQALFSEIAKHQSMSYLPVQGYKPKRPRSVSLRLTHTKYSKPAKPLLSVIKQAILVTTIDFTEDENLRPE